MITKQIPIEDKPFYCHAWSPKFSNTAYCNHIPCCGYCHGMENGIRREGSFYRNFCACFCYTTFNKFKLMKPKMNIRKEWANAYLYAVKLSIRGVDGVLPEHSYNIPLLNYYFHEGCRKELLSFWRNATQERWDSFRCIAFLFAAEICKNP